ncbi:spermidine/putrescine ABC transporter permease PotC [Candidatus Legionella polyplacis]|uniref:ABC transporter permease subunit n=1 Tax=Candidatus Legionella polyplacis TaxID=2005262 RepID=A0ABZ2GXS5_9GAMM|nr:ABC transporter permease subunit [Candidatus Legionella polyplacis]ATW01633.1 spermidine/putrescine ABC transporter permease PotC [Candidatus Legionella polyplacis]
MKFAIQKIYIITIYFFLYFPILILIIYSINDSKFSLQWHGLTFKWYKKLFQDHILWISFINSIKLGLSSSIITTIIAFFTCIYLFFHTNYHHYTIHITLIVLMIIPDLIFGISLLLFFRIIFIPLGFISLLIAHITFCLPPSILIINNYLNSIDSNIYFGAIDLGATQLIIIKKILFPILWPSILISILLCFTISIDDVIISYFLTGPNFNLLSLTIYSLARTGITPEINALCSITIGISIIITFIVSYLFYNQFK